MIAKVISGIHKKRYFILYLIFPVNAIEWGKLAGDDIMEWRNTVFFPAWG